MVKSSALTLEQQTNIVKVPHCVLEYYNVLLYTESSVKVKQLMFKCEV